MNKKRAKQLRRDAKLMTVGKSTEESKRVYKNLKTVYKEVKQGR